jgi:hypothetical protein
MCKAARPYSCAAKIDPGEYDIGIIGIRASHRRCESCERTEARMQTIRFRLGHDAGASLPHGDIHEDNGDLLSYGMRIGTGLPAGLWHQTEEAPDRARPLPRTACRTTS